MSYPNPNPNPNNPILGHNFITPDTISYRNLYKILSGGTLLCLTHTYGDRLLIVFDKGEMRRFIVVIYNSEVYIY